MVCYDAYQVCKNGHGSNSSNYDNPEFNQNFCTQCNAPTFKSCPSCGEDIEGKIRNENLITFDYTEVPDVCKHCGKDFPWRSKRKEAKELLTKPEKDDIVLLDTLVSKFHVVMDISEGPVLRQFW